MLHLIKYAVSCDLCTKENIAITSRSVNRSLQHFNGQSAFRDLSFNNASDDAWQKQQDNGKNRVQQLQLV